MKRRQISKCLSKEPDTYMSDLRVSSEEQGYLFFFKIHMKTQVSALTAARGFESMLFHYSITQDNVADNSKFTSAGEAWNILYAGYISKG